MKVKELVQVLVQLPPNAEIGVQTSWNWISKINEIQPIKKMKPNIQNIWNCKYTIITLN